jgi:hypothetical protein
MKGTWLSYYIASRLLYIEKWSVVIDTGTSAAGPWSFSRLRIKSRHENGAWGMGMDWG